jgi:hypothetical protein
MEIFSPYLYMYYLIVKFEDKEIKIRLHKDVTVMQLQDKIRKYLKINPEEAIFLFFHVGGIILIREVLYPGNKLISSVQRDTHMDPIIVTVMRENCFGV